MKTLFSSFLFVIFILPAVAYAQKPERKWEFAAHLSQTSFDSEIALEEGIDDGAISLNLIADYDASRWLTSVGIDILFYDDKNSFEVETIDSFGNEDTSDSGATGYIFHAAFGPKWNLGRDRDIVLAAQGGYGVVFDSGRRVGNCSNCPSSDIDIEGGLFVKFQAFKNINSTIALGLHYTNYVSSDSIDGSVGVILSSAY